MLPDIVEVVLVEEALAKPEPEVGQMDLLGIVAEPNASFVLPPEIFAMNMKLMEVGIAPAHGDLNRVVEISDAVVTAQQQAPPHHRANDAQHHFELVHTNQLRAGHRSSFYARLREAQVPNGCQYHPLFYALLGRSNQRGTPRR